MNIGARKIRHWRIWGISLAAIAILLTYEYVKEEYWAQKYQVKYDGLDIEVKCYPYLMNFIDNTMRKHIVIVNQANKCRTVIDFTTEEQRTYFYSKVENGVKVLTIADSFAGISTYTYQSLAISNGGKNQLMKDGQVSNYQDFSNLGNPNLVLDENGFHEK